jgi:hypothetical protein
MKGLLRLPVRLLFHSIYLSNNRSQGTEERMVSRLWRNYLLSGLAASMFIVGCGHTGHADLSENTRNPDL